VVLAQDLGFLFKERQEHRGRSVTGITAGDKNGIEPRRPAEQVVPRGDLSGD
jgi:hypothetical protein